MEISKELREAAKERDAKVQKIALDLVKQGWSLHEALGEAARILKNGKWGQRGGPRLHTSSRINLCA